MNRKTKPLPSSPVTAHIEKLSHDGRGIARILGKTTFIQGALPNETVTFQYLRKKSDYDEGRLVSVMTPSPSRVEPLCPHYVLCGGCSLQHLDGSSQIHEKEAWLLDLLLRVGKVKPDRVLAPLNSDLWHYRNKARLSVRYVEKKQATLVGFRERHNPRYITEIMQCPVLNAKVDAQIGHLRQTLDSLEAPECIAQIEVAAGDEEVALIFRNLSPLSPHDESVLKTFSAQTEFHIYLQPGGPDSIYLLFPKFKSDFLTYELPNEGIQYQFHPSDFTQVNAGLNRRMVKQALELLALEPHDTVLDLFCGLGNFSLPMAKYCAEVTGIEGSEEMVMRARKNAEANGLTNTSFFCANLEEESSLLNLLQGRSFSKLLLDPPRTGAFTIAKQIKMINPQRIVYVSCNPASLARDVDVLVNRENHRLVAVGVMDMFPHTAHVESIALLEKL